MAPRLSKRQQREQEEISALGGPSKEIEHLSEEDEESGSSRPIKTGYAALFTPQDDEPDEPDNDSDNAIEATKPLKARKKKKKKKKKGTAEGATNDEGLADTSSSMPPQHLPKQGKGKSKAQGNKDGLDEVDQALAELSLKYPDLKNISSSQHTPDRSDSSILASLLAVSLSHLDSEAEMRKFFGAKVISASKSADSTASPSRRKTIPLRSNLTRPQPSWWAAKQREGLSIRTLTEEEVREKLERQPLDVMAGEKWWAVEYSKKYKSMTMAFMRTVMAGDPQGFWDLIQKLPWHGDTLLQLAEVYGHREEYKQATDFVDRALFTYERSFIGAFNFTSGLNRLDFDRVENRPFFLAVHRQTIDLQRRGCVRTAFEFGRLLLSLDPSDPHGALFHLDYLAVKSSMGQWLLDVWDYFDSKWTGKVLPFNRVNVTYLPGWAYARALALRAVEGNDHAKSQAALEDAIRAFPSIVPLLADKLDMTLSSEIRGKKELRIHSDASALSDDVLAVLHLLSHLYVQRSSALWKDPALSTWFADTVKAVHSSIPSDSKRPPLRQRFNGFYSMITPRYSVWRHVIVMGSNYRNLLSFLPKTVLDRKSLACDPLPPISMVNSYDDEFFRGTDDIFATRTRRVQRGINREDQQVLERMIPDPALREQFEAFFHAHPRFADRFPGGILQIAEAIGQLPADIFEDMLMAEAADDAPVVEDNEAPLPEEADLMDGADEELDYEEEEEVDEEVDEDVDDDTPFHVRLMRGFINGLRSLTGVTAPEGNSVDNNHPQQTDGADVDE